MKIAVISDIHGNMEAVEAVMQDIEAKNCDKILSSVIMQWQDLNRRALLSIL